jgi:hypothetical protein
MILVYNTVNKLISYLRAKNSVTVDTMIRDTKYDEDEIIKHLDYIISEALSEYVILYINPQNVFYINSKLEDTMVEHLTEEVPKRLSKVLLTQLTFIYDEDYIGAFLGKHIYMTVVDYVLSYNMEHDKKES